MFTELQERGLIKQTSNIGKLRFLLDDQKTTFFIGFDPTAESLHVGHLLQLVSAKRLIAAGHRCIILIGSATAGIGDPSGKTDMRKVLEKEVIAKNGEIFKDQIKAIIGEQCLFVDNLAWFDNMKFLETIQEVGVHFSVNAMLRADCFKSRMERGLSFLEFNYMVMQAVDFLRLHQMRNCCLQIGGDDQWSNMLAGLNLISKLVGNNQDPTDVSDRIDGNRERTIAAVMTLPLLLTSSGQKMGKTEKGAIFLDSSKTHPFDFFQFFRNIEDNKIIECFKFLTFMPMKEIEAISMETAADINNAKKKLAFEITFIVHGRAQAEKILKEAEDMFEKQSNLPLKEIANQTSLIDLIIKVGWAASKTQARQLIVGNGIFINDKLIDNIFMVIDRREVGEEFVLRKGKKNFCKVKIL